MKINSQANENTFPSTPLQLDTNIDVNNDGDVYLLGSNEHLGLSLVYVPLNFKNFLPNRNIITLLEAKVKQRFIYGNLPRSKFGEPDYIR